MGVMQTTSFPPPGITLDGLKQIREDLSNVCMEARLSLEMEMQDTKATLSQVNSSFQTILSQYSVMRDAYVKECARRRKVISQSLRQP